MKHHQQYEATRHRISAGRLDLILTLAAGGLIIALTAVAFWLSYAHLHDVADTNGLAADQNRAWAWPATLDTFIVAGEVLILRASLRGAKDWWAYVCTGVGSVGSILLNVLGVPAHSHKLVYVVAAVPPTAAMLAFGLLMRQVHQIIGSAVARTDTAEQQSDTATDTVAAQTDTAVSVPVAAVSVETVVTVPAAPLAAPAEAADLDSAPVFLPADTAALVADTGALAAVPAPAAVPVQDPAPAPVLTAPRVVICGPAVHRPRILASDGALDTFPAAPVAVAVPQPLPALDNAGSAALDALLAAARRPLPARADSDTGRAHFVPTGPGYAEIEAEVAEQQRATYAEVEAEFRAAAETDTGADQFDTAEPATDTQTDTAVSVPAPGARLSEVELDAVVHMIRTETEPPRSFRAMEERFRELGYVAGAARLRAAWDRVTTEAVTA
ncbi:DUF2637 domain-containing protein [Kitasatospora sp. NPDC001309]|uniref:DUF2637 domain-containing protein n=1 Tax=Kitasatospora sp. NPDC001309 TaxID=3364013 RepID=UPI00368E1B00